MKLSNSFMFLSLIGGIFFCCGKNTTVQSNARPQNILQKEELAFDLPSSMERGKVVYETLCIACHRPNGKGKPGETASLVGSKTLLTNNTRAIRILLYGYRGNNETTGVPYDGFMPPQAVNDVQAADVINYIMNSWGNENPFLFLPPMIAHERR